MSHQARDKKGFTLLEVMITGSLLVLAVFYSARTMTQLRRQIDLIKYRQVAREVLDKELSKVESIAGFFPPLAGSDVSDHPLTYVACFTTRGVYKADSEAYTGFVARDLSAGAFTDKSGFCGVRDYEVHVLPDASAFNEADIIVFLMNDKNIAQYYTERLKLESAL